MDEAWNRGPATTGNTNRPPRVLVVDDEPVQLETIRRGLFLYGYETRGADDGDAAFGLFEQNAADIDLVVTDLTMPGCSGRELIRRIRARNPDFPVVVITGLAHCDEVEALRREGVLVVRKPFSPDDLDRAIRSILRRGRVSAGRAPCHTP
jgi:DNA-binding response OmpR family regulator